MQTYLIQLTAAVEAANAEDAERIIIAALDEADATGAMPAVMSWDIDAVFPYSEGNDPRLIHNPRDARED